MTTNPVVTVRHFAHRFRCLSQQEMIKGTGQFIWEVLDFFWRIEFQLRVHSMWWIKDTLNPRADLGLVPVVPGHHPNSQPQILFDKAGILTLQSKPHMSN